MSSVFWLSCTVLLVVYRIKSPSSILFADGRATADVCERSRAGGPRAAAGRPCGSVLVRQALFDRERAARSNSERSTHFGALDLALTRPPELHRGS